MNKTSLKLLSFLSAGILLTASSASAQSEDSILSSLFLETGGGYLFDTDEPYYFGRIGLDGGCGNKFYFSFSRIDPSALSGSVGGFSGSLDESINTFALGATFGFPVGDNGNFFWGIDLGVANYEADISYTDGLDTANLSLDDSTFYGSVTVGLEHSFTENLSLVGQVRYIYLHDRKFNIAGGNKISLDSEDDFAFELGIKFSF